MSRGLSTRRVLCLDNTGYETSLERDKIYVAMSDAQAEKRRQLRVVDESGEAYLYPAEIFGNADEHDSSTDAKWLKEAEDRLAAYRSSELGAVDAEEVFVRKVEELQDQIQKLSPEDFEKLRNWFWDLDWVAWDAQIEADVKSGKLDKLSATARRRLHELVGGEIEGIPGALVLERLRNKLSLSDGERAELDRALDAYARDRDPGRPAEDVIAEIKKKL